MSSLPGSTNVVPPEQPDGDTREIIYLVKRRSYSLAITVPRPSATRLCWQQAVVQVQSKCRGQLWSWVLNPTDLEMLYEDLRGLMAYLRERRRQPSVEETRAP
jgi:hypothetical protein